MSEKKTGMNGPDGPIDYGTGHVLESEGQNDGRTARFNQMLPLLREFFGKNREITLDNFDALSDVYVNSLLKKGKKN